MLVFSLSRCICDREEKASEGKTSIGDMFTFRIQKRGAGGAEMIFLADVLVA